MRKPIFTIFTHLGTLVVTGAILIAGGATPALANDAYTPTMKDMRSIQNALERYLKGFDTHNSKLQASAFWDDAVISGPTGQKMTVQQMRAMGEHGSAPGAPPSPQGG